MKIVFMGTPDFAVSALQALAEDGQEIALVLTQPDKPKGRGHQLTPSPVKAYAQTLGLTVETPATLRNEDVQALLRAQNADLFIVAAYGKLLPKEVLEMPRLGCVNIHASLLPAWRGAAPIQRALLNGDTVGGITMMYMDEGLDTGDIILQRSTDIPPDMDGGAFHDRLAQLGKEGLLAFLRMAESGQVPRQKQEGETSYAEKLTREEQLVTFTESAVQTRDRIRAFSPLPGAYSLLDGKRVKLFAASVADGHGQAGEVLRVGKDGVEVACADGSVCIAFLQPEGKGKMRADSFFNGLQKKEGVTFHG